MISGSMHEFIWLALSTVCPRPNGALYFMVRPWASLLYSIGRNIHAEQQKYQTESGEGQKAFGGQATVRLGENVAAL